MRASRAVETASPKPLVKLAISVLTIPVAGRLFLSCRGDPGR